MPGPEAPQPPVADITAETDVSDDLATIPGTGGAVDLKTQFYGSTDAHPTSTGLAEPAQTEATTGSEELEETRRHKVLRVAGGIGYLVAGLAVATGKYPGVDQAPDAVRLAMAGSMGFAGVNYLERNIRGAADRVRNRFGRKNQETVDPADS